MVQSSQITVVAPPLPPSQGQIEDDDAEIEKDVEFSVWPVVVSVNPGLGESEPQAELTLDQKADIFAKALRRNGHYTFDTRFSTDLNVEMKWPKEGDFHFPDRYDSPTLLVSRIFSGYGQEHGRMELVLRNRQAIRERRVTYLEVLPWFIKPYLHTLSLKVEADDYDEDVDNLVRFQDDLTAPLLLSLEYSPSPFQIEAQLRVPPQSTLRLTLEYDKSFLRYAQHPPDAHRGFDVAPAAILLENGSKIYTNPGLIEVAVPDFSMPYNVM